MKKKVLIFSTTYHPFVGGAEVAVKEITDRLGADFEFDLISLRFDKRLPKLERVGNVNVYRIGFVLDKPEMKDLVKFPLSLNKIIFPFISWWKAGDLYAEKEYDFTWAIMASYAGFGALFFKISHSNVPFLLTLQEGDPIDYIEKKVRRVRFLFNKIFTKADSIQAISNYLADWARAMNFKKDLAVVPNGVDVKFFSQEYSKVELDDLKSKIGKKENDKFIITTSRLVKKNAVDDVIKSLKFLPANFKFLILGDGPDKEMLEALIKSEKAEGRVIFAGTIGKEDLPKYLKISDIFIRPSLSEGFGNSFVEAMVADLPVVATQEGGIADFLFDRKRNPDKNPTGWAVNTRDPKGIAEAIKEIFSHPDQTKQTMANAKKMVEEKYDWEIVAERMKKEVFDKIS